MSRQRSRKARSNRRELFTRLLRDGARFQTPGAAVVEAAAELETLGLIEACQSSAVFCTNPDDQDFPPDDPDCPGLIELREGADECDGDYDCPVCGRVVYPTLDAKERIGLLTVTLDQAGIERFVLERCGDAAAGQSFEGGVLVLPDRPQNRFICITDFCSRSEFLDPTWLPGQSCAHVVVDPRSRVRLLPAAEVDQVELVDLICGTATLDQLLPQQPRRHVPTDRSASILSAIDELAVPGPVGAFIVSVANGRILVNNVVVGVDDGTLAYLSFFELWQQFRFDLAAGRKSEPLTAEVIADRVRGAADSRSVQKALNRLDKRIVMLLREAGFSINKGDVIKSGRYGFCLNKVALGA